MNELKEYFEYLEYNGTNKPRKKVISYYFNSFSSIIVDGFYWKNIYPTEAKRAFKKYLNEIQPLLHIDVETEDFFVGEEDELKEMEINK